MDNEIKVKVMKDGPLFVEGKIKLLDGIGDELAKQDKVALCRCGASSIKPYCDGSHYKVGFKD